MGTISAITHTDLMIQGHVYHSDIFHFVHFMFLMVFGAEESNHCFEINPP